MPDFNIEDPSKQERIRRGSHEYVRGDGRHGTYVETPYLHQEYPKVMDRTPAPIRKAFKTEEEFRASYADWEDAQKASTVKSKAEEDRWLAANGKRKQEKPEPEDHREFDRLRLPSPRRKAAKRKAKAA